MNSRNETQVLFVDCDACHAEQARKAFAGGSHGLRLTVAGSLREARERMKENGRPDLLVVDFQLPDGKGLDLLPGNREAWDFPAIVMTNQGSEEIAVVAMKSGALDYVVKTPETLRDMPHIAERTLREWRHIQEKRRAEKDLRVHNAILRTQIETSLDGIAVLDIHGRIILHNNRFKAMWGLTDKDITAGNRKTRLRALADKMIDGDKTAERIRSLAADSDTRSHDEVRLKNGRVFDVYSAPMRDADGTYMGRVWYSRDLTEERRIAREHAQLAQVVEQSVESIVIADAEGKVRYVNPAYVLNTGYTAEDAIGNNLKTFIGTEEPVTRQEEMWQTISRGEAWTSRHTSRRKSGEVCKETAIASPIHDNKGGISGYVLFQGDVTREDYLETQLRLAQRMEAVGQLAGGIAHDFNNILQAILGYLDLSIQSLPEGHEIITDLRDAYKAARRAVELTRQLLAFSRRQTLQPQYVNLNDLIQNLLRMLRRIIGENIELECQPAGQLGAVHVDPGQIEQALVNLCVNARDAMPNGGKIVIQTGNLAIGHEFLANHPWAKVGEYVMLNVSDTGCGMSAEIREHVFEPFFSTKQDKGTGLGLATVYGIVKQHNGYITVASEPGKGSSFHILLPLAGSPPREMEKILEAPIRGGKEIILLAEDEDLVRKLARRVLTEAGYTILDAKDGEAAVRLFKERPQAFDLAILDAVMPKLSGLGVYKELREIRPDIPILFSSGYSSQVVDPNIFARKEAEWIPKPYSPAGLLRKVRDILDRKD